MNALADSAFGKTRETRTDGPARESRGLREFCRLQPCGTFFDTDRSKTCLCACLAGLARLPTNPVSFAMFLDVYEGSLSFAWAALLALYGAIDQLALGGHLG